MVLMLLLSLWVFFLQIQVVMREKVEPTNITPTPVIFLPGAMLTMFSNLVTKVFFSKLAQTCLQATRLSTLRGTQKTDGKIFSAI